MVLCQLPDQRHSTLGTVDVTTDSNGQTVTAVTPLGIRVSHTAGVERPPRVNIPPHGRVRKETENAHTLS